MQLFDPVAGHTALISGSARGHDASPFNTSISMLIFRAVSFIAVAHFVTGAPLQIAVFKLAGTFYKGSR